MQSELPDLLDLSKARRPRQYGIGQEETDRLVASA